MVYVPGQSNLPGFFVGVLPLQVVNDESGLAESLERVLRLRWSRGRGLLLLPLSGGLDLGLSLLLWLLLLLRGLVRDGGLDEFGLTSHIGVDALVGNRLVPTGHGRVLLAPGLVEEELEATADNGGGEDVSEGDTLADEVGVEHEVVLHGLHLHVGSLLAVLNVLLVVRVAANERAEPAAEGGKDLSVGERHPAEDGGVVLLGLAEQGGLLVLGGD